MIKFRLLLCVLFMTIFASITYAENNLIINLNTASIEALQSVPHIGEKRAQDIIEYREKQGSFESIDDLHHVTGFNTTLIENVRDYLVVK